MTDQGYSFTALGRPVLQLSDGPVLQFRVTVQFYLESKGKHILKMWGHANPKDAKRREALSPIMAPLFKCLSPPLGPALYKLG